MEDEIKEQLGLKDEIMKKLKIKKVVKEDKDQQCSICIMSYTKGQ